MEQDAATPADAADPPQELGAADPAAAAFSFRSERWSEIWRAGVDRSSPVPLYHQIKHLLRRQIVQGERGERFPTETELGRHFAVSRPTIRQAIAELVSEGLLTRVAGSGTFIAADRVIRDFRHTFDTFDYEMRSSGHSGRTEILGLYRRAAPPEVARRLRPAGGRAAPGRDERSAGDNIAGAGRSTAGGGTSVGTDGPTGFETYELHRRRFADDVPLMTVVSYLPVDLLPDLIEHRDDLVALRKTMEHTYGLVLHRVVRRMEAIVAGADQAALLAIDPGAPIQYIESHVFLENGRCVEFSTAWYRGDRSRFVWEIDRDSLRRG